MFLWWLALWRGTGCSTPPSSWRTPPLVRLSPATGAAALRSAWWGSLRGWTTRDGAGISIFYSSIFLHAEWKRSYLYCTGTYEYFTTELHQRCCIGMGFWQLCLNFSIQLPESMFLIPFQIQWDFWKYLHTRCWLKNEKTDFFECVPIPEITFFNFQFTTK